MKPSVALLLAIGFAHARTSVHPQCEVVSLKQDTPPPGLVGFHFNSRGRFTATKIPLRRFIDVACEAGTNLFVFDCIGKPAEN